MNHIFKIYLFLYISQIESSMSAKNFKVIKKEYQAGIHSFITIGNGSSNTPLNTLINENPLELLILKGSNIGIGTTSPQVTLDTNRKDAYKLPSGNTTERPTGVQGYIRYNTESQQFEGFGAGNQWGSLGGVKSVAGDTYILAEYSAGNDDKGLHFYTSNIEQMILTSNGYLGIGTTLPRQRLDVNNGNAIISGNLGISTVLPQFSLHTEGTAGLLGGSKIVIQNGQDGGSSRGIYYWTSSDTNWGTYLAQSGVTKSLADNTATAGAGFTSWAIRNRAGSSLGTAGFVWENNDEQLLASIRSSDGLSYFAGNTGIGSSSPAFKLDVTGDAHISGPLIVNNTITAPIFSGTATQVSQILTRGSYLTGNNYNGSVATTWAVDADTSPTANKIVARDAFGNIYAANIGIGTSVARSSVDVIGTTLISGNVGINTITPIVSLEVWSSNAILLPKGTSDSRPTGVQGYIRYNTESQQFEGFGAGNQWGSLGGVKSVAGDTYILAEYTAGNDDKALHFYTNATEQMILNSFGNLGIGTLTPLRPLQVEEGALFMNGNVGIGTTIPNYTLDIHGDLNVPQIFTTSLSLSNLTVTGSYFIQNDNQYIRNTLQINPLRITQQVQNSSTSNFTGILTGLYKAEPQTTEVYVNGYKMAYSTASNKDYDVTYSLNNVTNQSIFSVTLEETPAYGDIVDIIVWPQYLDPNGMLQPGYVLQNINYSYWNKSPYDSNLYYTTGNIGIGTEIPIYPLDVPTNAYIQTLFGSNVYVEQYISTGAKIGINTTLPYTSLDIRTTDAILLPRGTTLERPSGIRGLMRYNTDTSQFEGLGAGDQWGSLGGVKSTDQQTYISAELTAGANDGNLRFYNQNNLNMIVTPDGNVGIGTASPIEKLHVEGNIYSSGTVITSNLRVIGDFVTMNTITSNTEQIIIENAGTGPALKVTQTGPQPIADFYDDNNVLALRIADGGSIGIGTTIPKALLDVQGGDAIVSGNIGIGTTVAREKLDIQGGNAIISGNIGIGTSIATTALDVNRIRLVNTNAYGQIQIARQFDSGYNIFLEGTGVTGTTAFRIRNGSGTNGGTAFEVGADTIRFYTNGNTNATEKMRLDLSGNLGIGSSSPVYKLDVVGNAYISGPLIVNNTITATSFLGTATQVSQTLTRGSYLTGANYNGSIATTWTVDATTAATANKIVARDDLGNIYAANIGIGTTIARTLLDIEGGNAIIIGNVGIRTTDPINTFHVVGDSSFTGHILPTNSNTYDLGSSNLRWRDIYLSGTTIDLDNTKITKDNNTGGIHIIPYGYSNQYSKYILSTSNVILPSSIGTINGVNITALNKRTRTSYASAYDSIKVWTSRISSVANNWQSICWAPELSLFCAVASSGTGDRIMTSPDGIKWSTQTSPVNNDWTSVCWAPELSLFCAVASTGSGDRVMTSSDGVTWTAGTSILNNSWQSVCWASELSLFVAVGINSGTGYSIMTSMDGIVWTPQSFNVYNSWRSVCWASELSLLVAVSDDGDNRIMTSSDGITWTDLTAPINNSWRSVCWAGELSMFVAVSSTGTTQRVMTSSDGINWIARNTPIDNSWWGVCWAAELSIFVAVGANAGTGKRIMTSPNGIIWTSQSAPANIFWRGICWAPELSIFTAIAQTGTNIQVMTSAIGMPNFKNVVKAFSNQIMVDAQGNIGIGTTTPYVALEIWASNAILLPKGTSSSRPTGVQGYIRYNTESQQFEGFGAGNQWGSLGGVKSVAGDTYILAEYSAGNDDKALHFYTNGSEQMILNSFGNLGIGTLTPLRPLQVEEGALFMNGNVGMGTTIPRYTLDVYGDFQATKIYTDNMSLSNLTVTGSYFLANDDQSIRNKLQLTPLRITQQTVNEYTSNFSGIYDGLYKALPETTEVYVNGYKMAYYSSNNKDYDVTYTLDTFSAKSTFNVTLVDTPGYGDIIDIVFWPQYLDPNGILQPGYVAQYFNMTYWNLNNESLPSSSNIYYNIGNVGIGTTLPNEKLEVYGNTKTGKGLSGLYNQYDGGPFFKQSGWDATGTSHTIAFTDYCIAENSSGTLNIQVKSITANKLGNSSVSFLNASGADVDLFNTFYHKTANLSTFIITASTNDIIVTTDSDCSISWTSIGSC